MNLLIYGAGGLGKEVFELACIINNKEQKWEAIYFVDDMVEKDTITRTKVFRYKEIGEQFSCQQVRFVIANGEPKIREELYEKLHQDGYHFASVIGPKVSILGGTQIEEGCVIRDDCQISADVRIGKNVYIQGAVHIGHDTQIGDHSIVSSMANIPGKVIVGKRTYIGPSVVMKDCLHIGDDVIVGIGSIVMRNIKASKIVLGYPAKVIGENTEKSVFHMF